VKTATTFDRPPLAGSVGTSTAIGTACPPPARHKGRGWDVDVSQKAASGTLIQGVTIEEIGERGTEILRLLQLQ
jgi:hypothetical protein